MGKKQKQVIYFYEGETEKNLLWFLKKTEKIKAGKLKKFNLWKNRFEKRQRTISKTDELFDELFFVVDTDDVASVDIFVDNIKLLNSYDTCLIIQNKNLEDELCFSCNKPNHNILFKGFYDTSSRTTFKRKFSQDNGLSHSLEKNNFDFSKLWSRGDEFSNFLNKNQIMTMVSIDCKYKK